MRCCWLLAIGLMIGSIGWQETFADDLTSNVSQSPGNALGSNDPEAQATLGALKAAVRVPPRRYSATAAGRPAPVVRLAKPSPYTPVKPAEEPASLDELSARLVSHNEPGVLPAASISEEMPAASPSPIRPATAFTPTPVGDLEEEPSAPAVTPIAVVDDKPLAAKPISHPERSQVQFEAPAKLPAEAPARLAAEPAVTVALKTTAEPVKRESSRAGGGFTTNPLRQSTSGTFSSRDLSNPLR